MLFKFRYRGKAQVRLALRGGGLTMLFEQVGNGKFLDADVRFVPQRTLVARNFAALNARRREPAPDAILFAGRRVGSVIANAGSSRLIGRATRKPIKFPRVSADTMNRTSERRPWE